MDKGTTPIATTNGTRVREPGKDPEERELDEELAIQLDHRRPQTLDWRLQVRRHARTLALIGAGLVIVGIGVTASIARKRRRHSLEARLSELAGWSERLRLTFGRIGEYPGLLTDPASAIGTQAAGSLALGTARVLPHIGAALSAMRSSSARACSLVGRGEGRA